MMWHGIDPKKVIRSEKRMYFAAKADLAEQEAKFANDPYFIPTIQKQVIENTKRLMESSKSIVHAMVSVLDGKLE